MLCDTYRRIPSPGTRSLWPIGVALCLQLIMADVAHVLAQGPSIISAVGENASSPYLNFSPKRVRLPLGGFAGDGPQRLPPVDMSPPLVNSFATNVPTYANRDPSAAPAAQPLQVSNVYVTPSVPTSPSADSTIRVNEIVGESPNSVSLPNSVSAPVSAGSQQELRVKTEPIVNPLESSPVLKTQPVDAARVVAIVGDQAILAGDFLGQINEILKQKEIPSITPQEQEMLISRLLPMAVDSKLVYLDYLRNVPADKLGEIQSKLRDAYDEHQLAKSMQNAGVRSESELDAKLRELGSSVDKQRRQFGEMVLAQQVLKEKVDPKVDVTRDDLVKYYEEHRDEYFHPASAKWEQLAVRKDRFGSAEEARQAVAKMGNNVYQGQSWADVARGASQGLTADAGGAHDWTQKGSLVSKVLDEAIFNLPVGEMSPQILEDDWGFHIIRVTERKEDSYDDFLTVQGKIREQLVKDRTQQARTEYIEKLRKNTYVYTNVDVAPK